MVLLPILSVFPSLPVRFYSDGQRANLERTWYELGTKEVGGRGEIGMNSDRKRLVISVLKMLKWSDSGSFPVFSL